MNLMTFILTVTMCWLVLFFVLMPIGINVPLKFQKGNADSAPDKHYIFIKIIISFLLSLIIASIFYLTYYG